MIPNLAYSGARWARAFGLLGIDRLYGKLGSVRGVVLQFHGSARRGTGGFSPYSHLDIEEGLFAAIIGYLKSQNFVFVSMDEIPDRLAAASADKRFCAVTFDHGYSSIVRTALPILRRNNVPHTIYMAAEMVEAKAPFWWKSLENLIKNQDTLVVPMRGGGRLLNCSTVAEKNAAIERIVTFLATEAEEDSRQQWVDDLCDTYGVNAVAAQSPPLLSWRELKELSQDPLCTIGSQGVAHKALARIASQERIIFEMEAGMATIEAAIGKKPRHFAYPFGDMRAAGKREFQLARDAGFMTAVTTRQGALYAGHARHLTALPRISINGNASSLSQASPLLSGFPSRLSNNFKRLDVS